MSRVKASVAALACAVCACVGMPAAAAARVDDAAATRAYLRASEADARTAYAELGASVAASEAHVSQIAGECPSALAYAPRDEAFGEIGEEARMAAFWAGAAPVRAATSALAHAIGGLRWTNRLLTRLVREQAAEERAVATLALPNVCADIAAWRTSAYAELPQSTATFLKRVEAIEFNSGRGEAPLGRAGLGALLLLLRSLQPRRPAMIASLLATYEGASERRTSRRIERLDAHVEKRLEAAAGAARPRLAAALGVSAL
jgi:hypothetical protein